MSALRPISEPLERPIRLGALISGGGTTLVNFVEQIARGTLNAEVAVVIASRSDCAGIARAKEAGLRCEVVPRRSFATVAEFSSRVFDVLREANVDLVTFAGFLSLLEIPDDFDCRVMNIHPALIPAFCGKGMYGHRVHDEAIARGVKVSGCTIHFADNQYDHGPIILQQTVPVEADDTADELAARVFGAECEAFPEAIRLFAAGRLTVDGDRVIVR